MLCPCDHSVTRSQVADGETAFRYGQQLSVSVYSIISHGQPTRILPGWGLCEVLTIPQHKNVLCSETLSKDSDLDRSSGTYGTQERCIQPLGGEN